MTHWLSDKELEEESRRIKDLRLQFESIKRGKELPRKSFFHRR
jgi:hypothetical protein